MEKCCPGDVSPKRCLPNKNVQDDFLDNSGLAFPTTAGDPGMSLRDYACIKLKVPKTDKEWLNEIIIESLGDYCIADAMMKEGNKE
jgi:hypothetical protein